MMSRTWKPLSALLASLATAIAVNAQTYSIDWFTIDGGGGTSSGGVYSVRGILGQPDAGTLSGGSYRLVGGFSGIVAAVQSPGAPLLSVERIDGHVRVFWARSSAGFVLDQSLAVTGAWSPVPFPYTTNATDISVTLASPGGTRFFKLRLLNVAEN